MPKPIRNSLIAGLSIMFFALLFDAVKAAWPLFYFVLFCPGFTLGWSLVHNQSINDGRKILLILISGLSYIFCFWIADVTHENGEILDSVKLLLASSIGSGILSISYLLLFKAKKTLQLMFFSIVLVGIISAIPCAIFMYLFKTVNHYPNGFTDEFNLTEFGLMAGIFTIYPLWQFTFGWITNMERFKTVSNITATAN